MPPYRRDKRPQLSSALPLDAWHTLSTNDAEYADLFWARNGSQCYFSRCSAREICSVLTD